jgi:hypothetical protein
MNYTTIDTTLDAGSGAIDINSFNGNADDPGSRIWPFKRMHTIQPYDKVNNKLVYMHLWGNDEDAYWGNYDFSKAIAHGMADQSKPYSGEFGFIDTYSFWPITHMVAPKEDALQCAQCHAREGRMQQVAGVYMPGRDSNRWVDLIGLLAVAVTLLGVLGHGLIRMMFNKGGRGHE